MTVSAAAEDRPGEAPAKETGAPETEAPRLPASFFSKLVRQPSCQTKGICDNCGRCEH